MLWCYVCGKTNINFITFRAHINRHASDYELTRPLRCGQNGCSSTFMQTFNFFRHIKHFHFPADDGGRLQPEREQASINDSPSAYWPPCTSATACSAGTQHVEYVHSGDSAVIDEGIALIASLRANSSMPYSVVPKVIDSINGISNSLISACQAVAVRSFTECIAQANSDNHLMQQFVNSVDNGMKALRDPFGFISSKYKLDSYFSCHESFVSPQSVNFGLRFETVYGKTKAVYDTFEYVSIQDTLKVLLRNEQYMRCLLQMQNVNTKQDIIGHLFDAEHYRSTYTVSNPQAICIVLQLFYDGMGTVNPLRGHGTMYNLGVFYYVVKNLPDAWNTCFANVHLLCLCYSHDLKVHGFGPILDKFASEMSQLSTTGFRGVFPIIGEATVYVKLCQVACDNLALNSLFGFVESFSGDFCCTMCYATRSSMQDGFVEECFEMRSRDEYNKDIGKLNSTKESVCHVRGVKRYCELNNIESFHVTENYSLDVMHIFLEGIVPLEIGCVLFNLVCAEKYFKLDELNAQVTEFWSMINVDRKNKPPHINRLMPPGAGLNPSMKAIQSWALLKYLPCIVGDRVPADDKSYRLLLHLSELVDLAFAPRFTVGLVAYMKECIKDHLAMFVNLFGNTVSLKPKHHLLVHLPSIILKSGPLVGMSCLKYELKNSFFKRSCHVVCNFSNICKTLAFRHQHYALYSILSNLHERDCIIVGKTSCMSVSSVLHGSVTDLLCGSLQLDPQDEIVVADRLTRGTMECRQGHYYVVDIVNDEPVFGEVDCFVCSRKSATWHILLRMSETIGHVAHLHSYAIKERIPLTYHLLTFSELLDYHPVCSYRKRYQNNGVKFLRLPYFVF